MEGEAERPWMVMMEEESARGDRAGPLGGQRRRRMREVDRKRGLCRRRQSGMAFVESHWEFHTPGARPASSRTRRPFRGGSPAMMRAW